MKKPRYTRGFPIASPWRAVSSTNRYSSVQPEMVLSFPAASLRPQLVSLPLHVSAVIKSPHVKKRSSAIAAAAAHDALNSVRWFFQYPGEQPTPGGGGGGGGTSHSPVVGLSTVPSSQTGGSLGFGLKLTAAALDETTAVGPVGDRELEGAEHPTANATSERPASKRRVTCKFTGISLVGP